MGLTRTSTGKHSIDANTPALKSDPGDIVIALAGNPNVGKSTVFNALTGMNQHTGNWTGKTVATACGSFRKNGKNHILVDLPGTYSLFTHSVEEEVARDFILSENADACIVVCDATCLERNLNLVLQIIEITPRTVVCINLMDEAKRKKISVDIRALSRELGVPVIGTSARSGKGLDELIDAVDSVISKKSAPIESVHYGSGIEEALKILTPALSEKSSHPRRDAMRILSGEIETPDAAQDEATIANEVIDRFGLTHEMIRDKAAIAAVMRAEDIFKKCVTTSAKHSAADRKLDRIFTGRAGIFAMLLLLAAVLWLTVYGANYPSNLLFSAFDALGAKLRQLLYLINAPDILTSALIDGVYRVLTCRCGHAPADGDILSAVHAARRFRISSKGSFQSRPQVQEIRRVRKTGINNVHGIRLQRGRSYGMPDNRFAARAPHGGSHERIRAVQRAIPDADIADFTVYRRRTARSV